MAGKIIREPCRVIMLDRSDLKTLVTALDEIIEDARTLALDYRADGMERLATWEALEVMTTFRDRLMFPDEKDTP